MENLSSAIFFDGLSAKPTKAIPSIQNEKIQIYLIDSHEKIYWPIPLCRFEQFNSSNKITISFGEFPSQQIQFNYEDFPELYETLIRRQKPLSRLYLKIDGKANWKIIGIGFILILIITWMYISFLSPLVGEKAVVLVPKEMEIEIGKKSLNEFILFSEKDDKRSLMLNNFYDLCCFSSEYPVQLHFINSNQINAFAAPGGQIVVFEGIIEKMDCYDELAGLLSHELAHVNKRHSMKNLTRSISSYLLLSAISGDVAGISGVFMEQASKFQSLANSREYELEADTEGSRYLFKNEIGSQGILKLMYTIQKTQKQLLDSLSIPESISNIEFLSTHPATDKRISLLEKTNAEDLNKYEYRTDLDSIFQLIKYK